MRELCPLSLQDLSFSIDQNANAWLALASSHAGMPAEAEACLQPCWTVVSFFLADIKQMPLLSSPSFTPRNTEGAVLPLIITGLCSAKQSAPCTTLTLSFRKQGVEGCNEEYRFRFRPQNCWSSANGNK